MSIERVNAGDRLAIRAADWNELARTSDFVEDLRNRTGGAGSGRQALDPAKAYGYNSTGSALASGNIVSVSDLAIDLVDGEWPVFDLGLPDDARLGIMLESVPATGNYAGLVCVAGVARTKVNVTDSDHQFAQPNGTLTALDSSESGPIRILWAEGEGDDQDALVRIEGSYLDGFPDILRIVTNVCDVGEATGNVFAADDAYVINSTGGQAVVVGEVEAQEGFITVRAVLDWSDPGYEATTGDTFSFYLVANGSNHTGAPKLLVTFVGDAATNQKEMVWKIAAEPGSTVALQLWAYRVAGSGQLTAAVTSRLEVQTAVAGKKVEYRQLILNGAHVGPKICVMNPTDCCVDDESSTQDDTASDLITNCCSVPIPAMRMVDLTGVEAHLPGWWGVWQGAWNFDTLIQAIADELNKVHYLPYMGTVTNTRVRCVYGKNISIPGAFGLSAEGYWQPSGPPIGATSTVYYPTFNIQIRFYISERLAGESSQFFDYTPTPPYGNPAGYIDAPEYQAHCRLGIEMFTNEGPWNGPFLAGYGWEPHYTKEFHATQNTLLGNEVLTPYSNTLPVPATSCAGACRLWWPGGPFQTTEPVTYPWKVTVDPV